MAGTTVIGILGASLSAGLPAVAAPFLAAAGALAAAVGAASLIGRAARMPGDER